MKYPLLLVTILNSVCECIEDFHYHCLFDSEIDLGDTNASLPVRAISISLRNILRSDSSSVLGRIISTAIAHCSL